MPLVPFPKRSPLAPRQGGLPQRSSESGAGWSNRGRSSAVKESMASMAARRVCIYIYMYILYIAYMYAQTVAFLFYKVFNTLWFNSRILEFVPSEKCFHIAVRASLACQT